MTAPILVNKMEAMNKVLMDQDEWHYISMDATRKICMKLMGQASYRSPKSVRNEAPFGDDVAWRRLLTIEGGTPWGPCIYSAFSCFIAAIAKITLEIEG